MASSSVCSLVCFVFVLACMPTRWALPVNNGHVADTGGALPAKLQTILQSVADRQDTNTLDLVLETNAGLGLNLFEGDIQGLHPTHRNAMRDPYALWTGRTVPYVIDSSVDAEVRGYIQEAIGEYHSKTCIRWVPRHNHTDYVIFTSKTGCYSMVGKSSRSGGQEVSLMSPCAKKGSAMHEMLHVLGFFHEHSRPDRDQWVTVLLQNVRAGKELNFDRLPIDMVNTLGVQYDYGSIMHYSRTAFSATGQPTLLPKRDPRAILGQRDGFSARDLEKINKLYRCDLVIPDTPTTPHHSHSQPSKETSTHPTTTTSVTSPAIGWTGWSTWSDCDMQCRHFRYRYCANTDLRFCPGQSQEFATCAPPCQAAVSLGCWTNEPSSYAIPSVEGLYPHLNDSYRFRVAAVRRCADVATLLGHSVFALLDGGQCLTSDAASRTYSLYGPSSACAAQGKGGGTTAMNVYSFNTDMDGGWGAWTDWGQCSSSCGGGRKYRYRKCDSPPPIGQGQPCQGHDQEVTTCNLDNCQVTSHCGVGHHVGRAGSSGYIQVLNYQNYMNCDYVIESGDADVTISVTVTRMDIEPSTGCIYDALTIYDGADDRRGQFLGAFCGHTPPSPLQSSGPSLFLRFSSDASGPGGGFTLQFVINSNNTHKACTRVVKPYHGTFVGSNFVGDRVVFSCDPGTHLVGQSEIRCVDQPGMAVWSDAFPVCLHGRSKRGVNNDVIWNCSFEDNLCGFRQEVADMWRWMVATGDHLEPLQHQRPKADHSGSPAADFLYVESNTAWHPFDSARVTSPRRLTPDLSPLCLCFWHRVHGNSLVYLQLLQQQPEEEEEERGEGGGTAVVWEAEGEEEGGWKKTCVNLLPRPFVQVTFEAFLGQKLATSVGLDDVTLISGPCSQ